PLAPVGSWTDDADAVGRHPDDHAVPGDEHQLVVRLNLLQGDDSAGLVGLLERDDALPAPFLHPVVGKLGALAESLLAHDKECRIAPDHHHADDLVALVQFDALHTTGDSTHLPDLALVEPDAHPASGGKDYIARLVAELYVDQLVARFDVDRIDTGRAHVAVGREHGLLHRAQTGGEHEPLIVGEFPHRHGRGNPFVGFDRDTVHHLLHPTGPGARPH